MKSRIDPSTATDYPDQPDRKYPRRRRRARLPSEANHVGDERPASVADRRTSTRTPAERIPTVRDRINKARNAIRTPEFETTQQVSDIIIGAFKKRGDFYHDGVRSYVFVRDRRALVPIDQYEANLQLILNDYGLFPSERLTTHVVDGLRLHCLRDGRESVVHDLASFDPDTNTCYMSDFGGGMYRITRAGVDRVDNGTDGVLCIGNRRWKPSDVRSLGRRGLDWVAELTSGVRFAMGALSAADQRLLLKSWVLGLFFPELFPTRPILAVIGDKGSGKTSLVRRLGRVLLGPGFNVTALTAKPDDFDAAITTDPFVVADNADAAPPWLQDRLAVVATGGTIKRRAYYTTADLVEFPIRATLAVTSRTPDFAREDVAERLLPLKVQRIEQFVPEAELLLRIDANRDALLAAILRDVAEVVRHLRESTASMSTVRMADFAQFTVRIAPVLAATPDEAAAVLSRLGGAQVDFAAEHEPLLPFIDRWLADESHVNVEREISTSRLAQEIEVLCRGPLPWERGSSKSFGQVFANAKGTLREVYGLSERSARGGVNIVSFKHPRQGDIGDFGDNQSVPSKGVILTDEGGEE